MNELTNAEKAIIEEINRKLRVRTEPLLVALDGRSGVGKSTIAKRVGEAIGAVVIDSDKFYSGGNDTYWDSRTIEQKVSEVIDWKRLRKEALEPLLAREPATYYPFDFKTWKGQSEEATTLVPANVIILDGAYSARPELSDLIGLSVLIKLKDNSMRHQRLIEREGEEYMTNWHARWDKAEDYYFNKVKPESSFDLKVISE